ncbi:MAG: sugar ABC transporter substrate-binding protein [Eubacteriales bacterium]|nr:sugar ABC transporter substrate-binding protein [Eubacteriales bacterium]
MSKKILALVLMVAMMAALVAGCASTATTAAPAATTAAVAETTAAAATETVKIGYAMSNFDDKWLTYMREAAEAKAAELGVEFTMVDAKDDAATQLGQIENFVAQGVDAIVVVPVNTDATEAITKAAFDAKIPLIAVNRNFKSSEDYTTYVGSNSIDAGVFQMEYIGEKLGGKGNIVIMRGADGHEAAAMRTQGNLDVIAAKYPDIKVLENDTSSWDRAKGMAMAENWLQKYGEEINAFVCNNDEMAIGAVKAIENAGLTGKILVAGVDCTPDALVELKKGTLSFTVFQDPKGQGAGGVQAAYDIATGKTVEKIVWIPYVAVPPSEYDTYAAFWGM